MDWYFFAGLLFACSQGAQEPVKVGTAQVELRSDLVLPEAPGASTTLLAEENPDHPGRSANFISATRRIVLSRLENDSKDRTYRAVKRYEYLPDLLAESKSRKSSAQNTHTSPSALAGKHWVRGGKGFGVAAEGMASSGTVHSDDASYYSPTVALKPYSKASEHLEPIAEPFKSRKPHIFHSRATGFTHELPAEAAPSGHSPAFETRLSPIPETRVYMSSKPRTKVTLAPAKNHLDLMKGNENLNRHRYQNFP